jgi:hypothetical protein
VTLRHLRTRKILAVAAAALALAGVLAGCGGRADRLRDRGSSSSVSNPGPAVANNPAPAANDPASADNDLSDVDGLLNDVDSDLTAADAAPADAD